MEGEEEEEEEEHREMEKTAFTQKYTYTVTYTQNMSCDVCTGVRERPGEGGRKMFIIIISLSSYLYNLYL